MVIPEQRDEAVAKTLQEVRSVTPNTEVDRDELAQILRLVESLAAHPAYWSEEQFPPPAPDEHQARYLISEDSDKRFALYLNVMRPGKLIPPHNHTTWACIAGVEGEERNYLYRRLDDGSVPGKAQIEHDNTRIVGPGSGVALLGSDIHSVEIRGDAPIRHLHLYGQALETLTERMTFDQANGTCRVMDIGVQTRR